VTRTAGPPPALSGVRVLDLGEGISGPFAARLLGDFGADVVKLEPRGGDSLRSHGPLARDRSGRERSALFEYLNWNKRSVQVDLDEPGSGQAMRALVEWADIVITGFRPARLDGWRLLPGRLRAWNPDAIIAAVTDFGLDGPYRDYRASDLVLQAMGGVMQISGEAAREPIKPGLRQSYYLAGLNCAYAALAAFAGHAGGALIDISVMECVASQLVMNQPFYAFTGVVQRRGTPQADPILTGQPIPVRDGYVSLQGNTFIPMSDIADLFADPRLRDPEFTTTTGRQHNFQRLRDLLAENLALESGVDFFIRTCSRGLLAGVVQNAAQLLGCEQLAAREHFHASADLLAADGTPLRFPARLVSLSATPSSVRRRAPACGEHTSEFLDELAAVPSQPRPGTVCAEGSPGALAGLRVIDLSAVFAVPYIGGLLADLGAEVIKVESPWRLDQSRAGYGATYENDPGTEFWNRANTFEVLNRGKRVICIDLRSAGGQDLLRRLAAEADIILDNFTPRVLRQWNLTFAELSRVNPRLIMLSNTGFGSTGPWSAFKSQGTTLEATMGWMNYTGYPDGPPSKAGQSLPDFIASWTGLLAVMVALTHRDRTGQGQYIDLGMYQLGPCMIPEALLDAQLNGPGFARGGAQDIDALLSGVFPIAQDDGWLAISLRDVDDLRRLATVIPPIGELAPGDLEEIRRAITDWSSSMSRDEAFIRLQRADLAAGPVADAAALIADPQLCHRRFYEWVDFGQDVGRRPLIGRPYRWSGATSVRIRRAASRFAADNDAVLTGILRLSEAETGRLRRDRVVFDGPAEPPAPPPPYDLAAMTAAGIARADPDYHRTLEAARKITEEPDEQLSSRPPQRFHDA
jgi:crotonobetainyl-CoA:carnitine CoA-transferase CaiB-like acyl-CoA transferase